MIAGVGEFDGLPPALHYRQAIMVLQRRDLMGQRRLVRCTSLAARDTLPVSAMLQACVDDVVQA
jgi:hypothetical protein